jgi:hypothetical protein
VGEPVGFLQVLGGQQDGGAAGHQVLDVLPQVHARARIQAAGRLVQDEHRRLADQAGGQV